MNNNIFYVYAYLREKDSTTGKVGTVFYFGKGSGKRAYQKHGSLKVPKDKKNIVFISENLSEEAAFALEMELIAKYGRVDVGTGILRNRTDGGEGTVGAKHNESTKMLLSAINSGENHPQFGTKKSKETIEKMRASNKGVPRVQGVLTCPHCEFTGRTSSVTRFHFDNCKSLFPSPKVEKLMKKRNPTTKQTKDKIGNANRGSNNGMFGEHHSAETKEKIGVASRGKNNPMFGKTGELSPNYGKKRPLSTCPHCDKTGADASMKRYHFDNCKSKPNASIIPLI
jgi:hypothetical protein